jgi:hypothetical protein
MIQGRAGSGSAFGRGRLLRGAFQKTVQACAADAQDLRGADAIAIAHFQDAADVDAADFVERQRAPIFFERGGTALRLLQPPRRTVQMWFQKFKVESDGGEGLSERGCFLFSGGLCQASWMFACEPVGCLFAETALRPNQKNRLEVCRSLCDESSYPQCEPG